MLLEPATGRSRVHVSIRLRSPIIEDAKDAGRLITDHRMRVPKCAAGQLDGMFAIDPLTAYCGDRS